MKVIDNVEYLEVSDFMELFSIDKRDNFYALRRYSKRLGNPMPKHDENDPDGVAFLWRKERLPEIMDWFHAYKKQARENVTRTRAKNMTRVKVEIPDALLAQHNEMSDADI